MCETLLIIALVLIIYLIFSIIKLERHVKQLVEITDKLSPGSAVKKGEE